MFRADDVIAQGLDRIVRYKDAHLPPDLVARRYNEALRHVVREVTRTNAEVLNQSVVIPPEEVDEFEDYVDLTRGSTIEWQTIDSIDWRSSASGSFRHPVSIGSHEARHRIDHEFDHMEGPKGYLSTSQTRLEKLSGWQSVHDLRVTGTLQPEPVTAEDTRRTYPWFEGMKDATAAVLASKLAVSIKMDPRERRELKEEAMMELESVLAEAKFRVSQGAHAEDIPFFSGY